MKSWAKVETQLNEMTWGDSPWVSEKEKFKCISECWDARKVDSLPVSRDITERRSTVLLQISHCSHEVRAPPHLQQKWCGVNDGVVQKGEQLQYNVKGGENCSLNFCSPCVTWFHVRWVTPCYFAKLCLNFRRASPYSCTRQYVFGVYFKPHRIYMDRPY